MNEPIVGGRYEIVERIGIGGMGIVYRAVDTRLRREVALKVIAPHLVQQENARARFLREAQALAGLSHPNIVTVYDLAEDEESETVYIVMELLIGSSLRQCMSVVTRPAFSHVAIEVCRALECAHGKGVLHRDIKPENIFVCQDGTIKLMDFGLARLLGSASKSQASLVAGTVAYMSPEQLRGDMLDERTDLYALGVLMYEYLCGSTPFTADNPGAILMKHLTESPSPLVSRVPGLDPDIEAIVLKLLSKSPDDRYPSAGAVREALDAAHAGTADRAALIGSRSTVDAGMGAATILTAGSGETEVAPARTVPAPAFVPPAAAASRRPILPILGVILIICAVIASAALRGRHAAHGGDFAAHAATSQGSPQEAIIQPAVLPPKAMTPAAVPTPVQPHKPDATMAKLEQVTRELEQVTHEEQVLREHVARMEKPTEPQRSTSAKSQADPGPTADVKALGPRAATTQSGTSGSRPSGATRDTVPGDAAAGVPRPELAVRIRTRPVAAVAASAPVEIRNDVDCIVYFYAIQSAQRQLVFMRSATTHLRAVDGRGVFNKVNLSLRAPASGPQTKFVVIASKLPIRGLPGVLPLPSMDTPATAQQLENGARTYALWHQFRDHIIGALQARRATMARRPLPVDGIVVRLIGFSSDQDPRAPEYLRF